MMWILDKLGSCNQYCRWFSEFRFRPFTNSATFFFAIKMTHGIIFLLLIFFSSIQICVGPPKKQNQASMIMAAGPYENGGQHVSIQKAASLRSFRDNLYKNTSPDKKEEEDIHMPKNVGKKLKEEMVDQGHYEVSEEVIKKAKEQKEKNAKGNGANQQSADHPQRGMTIHEEFHEYHEQPLFYPPLPLHPLHYPYFPPYPWL